MTSVCGRDAEKKKAKRVPRPASRCQWFNEWLDKALGEQKD